ncbi:hypothetical protein POM88_048258 [Heracleum sosnowskyi]|uniref:RBR-type E3 ubiquitin transferase n=1 Tax=Heracleum sosnowskyi TaxID=360622 RepID=A0AAD8GVF4_9APIA|nr:hypothetical protein POM88_048258 [Heracleum sosnowskyi]
MLSYESKVYKHLQGGTGIPNIKWFGVQGDYNVLVMDMLGPSLEDLFNFCGRKFSMKTVLIQNKKLTGTARYASLNIHLGIEPSRRDDMESIGYLLMYFLRGSLPWQGLEARTKKEKFERISEKKVSIEALCCGYPTEFADYFYYCRSLRFEDKPDYAYLKRLFSELFKQKGFQLDYVFDWTVTECQQVKIDAPLSRTLDPTAGTSSRIRPANQYVDLQCDFDIVCQWIFTEIKCNKEVRQQGPFSIDLACRHSFGLNIDTRGLSKQKSPAVEDIVKRKDATLSSSSTLGMSGVIFRQANVSGSLKSFTTGNEFDPSHSLTAADTSDDLVSPTFMCEICVEPKPFKDSFPIKGCTHCYCSDCIQKYVALKLQFNITQILCPHLGCKGLLEPIYCQSILPPEVYNRWGDALCEALIPVSLKFYCPFKECSELLIQDTDSNDILESECPTCRRLFCAKCMVPWHSGIKCGDFQKLHKNERESGDLMLMQLAKKNRWTRCPECKFYVERTEGCLFMKCRCGHTFCYNCGAPMVYHFCTKCKH